MDGTLDKASEWTTVSKNDKRRITKRSRQRPQPGTLPVVTQGKLPPTLSFSSSSSSLSIAQVQQSLDDCVRHLLQSFFYKNLQAKLGETDISISINQIVCYGIGNFFGSSSSGPMWQLACAVSISHWYNSSSNSSNNIIPMYYFDPCMTPAEGEFLKSNSIDVIETNERGKRPVSHEALFFMPHCPMTLYSNLLHTNWDQLDQIIVFGNSLRTYANRLLATTQNDNNNKAASFKILQVLQPYTHEEEIPMNKDDLADMPGSFEKAFNDSFVTRFAVTSEEQSKWPDRPVLVEAESESGGDEVF
jgi:hypothetical protein